MENTFFLDAEKMQVTHQTQAPIIAVKVGETGFYPIFTKLTPAELNHAEVTEEVLEAAFMASLFGWDVPGARPASQFAAKVWS